MSHTVKLFAWIVNHMLKIIIQLGIILFVFRRERSTMDPVVDRPLLNTKRMLHNCIIVFSMWFTIRSNSFTVWDISFILPKWLHSSMIPFPLNSGVSSLNLHEYGMADVSTASIFFSRHTIYCSLHLTASCFLISSTDIGDTSPSVFRAYSSCPFG